jgi:hypothetical protein
MNVEIIMCGMEYVSAMPSCIREATTLF